MSWFRMESGVSRNKKLLALTPAQRWVWLDMICWATEHSEADGHVPPQVDHAIPGLRKLRPKLHELALLDADNAIHDWFLFTSASVEDKVRWYLNRYPTASANEVARQVRGNHKLVLKLVKASRNEGNEGGSVEPGDGGSEEPDPPSSAEPPQVVPAAVPADARYGTVRNEEKPSVAVTAPIERRAPEDDLPGDGDGPDDETDPASYFNYESILKEA